MATSVRRPAIREKVAQVPALPRVKGGVGTRFELKVDVTPDEITITGEEFDYTQAGGSRELFDRHREDAILAASTYMTELLMRCTREVPRG